MFRSIRTGLLAGAALVGVTALQSGEVLAQLQDQTQISPSNDLPNPYGRVHPWGELPTGPYDERASFIGAEEGPDGNIYLLGRCLQNSCTGRSEPPVLKLDPTGKLLKTWGSGMMDFPHGFDVDDEGNVWASDQRGHQVFKWNAEGQLLMTLGQKGRQGDPPQLLTQPTDLVVAPNGNIFVTEGHGQGGNRVSKYSSEGTFIMSWGTTGSGAGQFVVPHTIALDSQGRVFVGDRMNNRIQIFDQDGEFLDVWYQFGRPSGISITPDDMIYVADSESWGTDNPGWKKGIRVGNARDGTVLYLIDDLESTAIEHSGAEGVGVDSEGNVYGAVVRRRMLEKHVPDFVLMTISGTPQGGAHTHIAHVSTSFPPTPDAKGLAATAATEAGIALLHANFAAGNLANLESMRLHAGHVLHALDPAEGTQGPGLGFGLIRAAEGIATHIELAANAPGASANVHTHAGPVALIARSTARRSGEAAAVARRLQAAPSIRRASPLVAQLRLLMYQIVEGGDLNGDQELSLEGEAGVQQLEAHIYPMLEGEGLPRTLK
jgi:sugar lactone lactonase YvrE